MALRGKFQRPQNRPATIEYTEKGLSKLCCKTQRNLESPLFQAFFSTYVPEKAFSVCIKDSVFIDPQLSRGIIFTSPLILRTYGLMLNHLSRTRTSAYIVYEVPISNHLLGLFLSLLHLFYIHNISDVTVKNLTDPHHYFHRYSLIFI